MRQTNLRRTADYRLSIGRRCLLRDTRFCHDLFPPSIHLQQSRGSPKVFSGRSKAHGAALRQHSRATNPTHVHFWTCRFLGQRRPMRYRIFRLEGAALLLVRCLAVQTQSSCHNIAMYIIASTFRLIGPYDAAAIRCCRAATSKAL